MLKLFPDVKLILGYTKSMLLDTTSGKCYLIPTTLGEIIQKYDSQNKYEELSQLLGEKNSDLFQEYNTFLTKKELLVDVDAKMVTHFEAIDDQQKHPFDLNHIIICLGSQNWAHIKKAIKEKFFSNTAIFTIVLHSSFPVECLEELIALLKFDRPIALKIIASKNEKEKINALIKEDLELFQLIFTEHQDNYFESDEYRNLFPILSNSIILYSESEQHNFYFHKKLFIDLDGYIRNTPESYTIHNVIQQIEDQEEFKNLTKSSTFQSCWHVTRDQIAVCKDCELRRICIDNREPLPINDFWMHEVPCSYNPYICKWESESDYIPVEECGTYSSQKGFIPDNDKIKLLNATMSKGK